jgi:hypothetical protein
MKASLLSAFCFLLLFSSCVKDKTTKTFQITRPVYKLKQEVYDGIGSQAPTPIRSAGKIFLIGNYIFLSEKNKGVHIINNSNPEAPVNQAFIPIPGTEDVVVKGNILLADCFIDLLSIDISDPNNVKLVHVASNVFPERRNMHGHSLDTTMVVTEWITKDTTMTVNMYHHHFESGGVYFADQFNTVGSPSLASGNTAQGVGGSMARFTIVNQYLYTVSEQMLRVFDIQNPTNPLVKSNMNIGWNIETIYPLQNRLFIGSRTGMYIYSISNPTSPVLQGTFAHANVCDPVIADEHFAYVTLRSGTVCQGFINQLDVVDISNITQPTLRKSYPFTNPHGLSKDGHLLFICDGKDGLKVLNAANPDQITLLSTIQVTNAYDVIAWQKRAYVSAEDGIYQFDYSNETAIRLLSKIVTR